MKRYGPAYNRTWRATSRRIRVERAGNRCERCGVANHQLGRRDVAGEFTPLPPDELAAVEAHTGSFSWPDKLKFYRRRGLTYIILSVAHLDRTRTNDADNNLEALCQKCHFGYDMSQHVANRRYGRDYQYTVGQLRFDRHVDDDAAPHTVLSAPSTSC